MSVLRAVRRLTDRQAGHLKCVAHLPDGPLSMTAANLGRWVLPRTVVLAGDAQSRLHSHSKEGATPMDSLSTPER